MKTGLGVVSTKSHATIQFKIMRLKQARIQKLSSRGVQPSGKFWPEKKGKERGRVGRSNIYSALVWSKSIFAIETALQTMICIDMTSRVVFSRPNTFEIIVLAL